MSVEHPVVGEVYVACCTVPFGAGEQHATPVSRWFRVRLLSHDKAVVNVLAVDFGFTASLPPSALRPLPSECRGIPPQVSV